MIEPPDNSTARAAGVCGRRMWNGAQYRSDPCTIRLAPGGDIARCTFKQAM
ncbi:MAG TPA: hypothetical protein PKZ84_23620 [Anaerolineae bacterium]|nr:hypothetical protein [Anaerolineae bacterium]